MIQSAQARPYYSFDEFLRRRSLLTEYKAHRILAAHGPHETCAECQRILVQFPPDARRIQDNTQED
jgi:hypothetical protein